LVDRETPIEVRDADTFVLATIRLHEDVAGRMTTRDDRGIALTETISSEEVERLAALRFRRDHVDISSIVGCSVLAAISPRSRGVMNLKFLLRILQEFFLASLLKREGHDPTGYPDSVIEIWEELCAAKATR
jgi:hypothetical protein